MPKTLNKHIIIMSKQMLNYLPVPCARSSLANSTYHSKDKTIDKSCGSALMICIPTSVALSRSANFSKFLQKLSHCPHPFIIRQ